jgi:hypothetical protein
MQQKSSPVFNDTQSFFWYLAVPLFMFLNLATIPSIAESLPEQTNAESLPEQTNEPAVNVSGVATSETAAPTSTKYDGEYIGPADVASVVGDCGHIAGIMLTIKGNSATVIARRVLQYPGARYAIDTKYEGIVSGTGKVSVVSSKEQWSGSGIIRGKMFKGDIMNGDPIERKSKVCKYKLRLDRE